MPSVISRSKGLAESNVTNRLKGLNKFVKQHFPSKRDIIYNDIIYNLESTGLYRKWFDMYYTDPKINKDDIPIKISKIFETYDYIHPDKLTSKMIIYKFNDYEPDNKD